MHMCVVHLELKQPPTSISIEFWKGHRMYAALNSPALHSAEFKEIYLVKLLRMREVNRVSKPGPAAQAPGAHVVWLAHSISLLQPAETW